MAKVDFDIAVAFAPQSAEGSYDATLDAISATLGTADGLVLGDPESGIGESGIDFTVGRRSRAKAPVAGSFTRPLSDFLAAEVRSFSFSFPFCGNRADTTATPVDGDFAPIRGIEALLNGAGLVASTWAGGVGYSIKFGSPPPFSCLLYYSFTRLELLDCRCSSLAIEFTPGSIPVATAQITVGSIQDPTQQNFGIVGLPTLDYTEQATVAAPVIEQVAHQWQDTKGFQSLTLTVTPTIDDIPDSNVVDGILKEASGRETRINATLFADDGGATGEVYETQQALVSQVSELDALSFTVGTAASGSDPALAVFVTAPTPALDDSSPQKLGSKAGNEVNLICHNASANEELEIRFV